MNLNSKGIFIPLKSKNQIYKKAPQWIKNCKISNPPRNHLHFQSLEGIFPDYKSASEYLK